MAHTRGHLVLWLCITAAFGPSLLKSCYIGMKDDLGTAWNTGRSVTQDVICHKIFDVQPRTLLERGNYCLQATTPSSNAFILPIMGRSSESTWNNIITHMHASTSTSCIEGARSLTIEPRFIQPWDLTHLSRARPTTATNVIEKEGTYRLLLSAL